MIIRWPCRQATRALYTRHGRHARLFSASVQARSSPAPDISVGKTRNIGIIAHIDAGKTTTTERMLYYSGFTRRLGDVDEGSTVTDFLPAERARGITIQSAAITFSWPPTGSSRSSEVDLTKGLRSTVPHNINLIDTPGHADFTFEVLRSLRILDGAVCILDGVAGVEAQTEKVWTQASHYQIPRILFVNKLDRDGAAFSRTVREIGTRLNAFPALCMIPWWRKADGKLQGVFDVTALKGLLYEEGGDGKSVQVNNLEELQKSHPTEAAELQKARVALIEVLSEHDDEMVEKFLEHDEDHLAIPQNDVLESLRRCVLHSPQRIVPVYAGASFRNVGVQPLLDAVVDLLPSPEQRPDPETSLGKTTTGLNQLLSGSVSLPSTAAISSQKSAKAVSKTKDEFSFKNLAACALAFKVVTDPRRGVLVYVRVYSGSITRNAALFNTNLQVTEKAQRLMRMYANEAIEIPEIAAGQIGVIPGLKHARTGDTLLVYTGANPKTGPPAPLNSLQLRPIEVPPPVFFTSVEPNSLSEEKHIAETLALLLREDPSLSVTQDTESGQTHLAGMGELHLEIARDRLINDLKAKARIGSIQIGYREAITAESSPTEVILDREIAGKISKAGCSATVGPKDESVETPETTFSFDLTDNNHLTISTPTLNPNGTAKEAEHPSLPSTLPIQTLLTSFQTGVSAALARGPSHGYPLHSTNIHLNFNPSSHLYSSTTPAALSSAARTAVAQALRSTITTNLTVLMEPVMLATISVDDHSLGNVVHDLSSARGAQIISLGAEDTSPSAPSSNASNEALSPIDPRKIYTPPDPFADASADVGLGTDGNGGMANQTRQIVARVPLKEMVGYLKHLRSLTQGRGTFVMSVDRFERMSAQRMKIALTEMRGDYV